MLRIARAPAVRFVGALVAIMCLGLVGTACAADGAPRLRVDYQPPRLSVDAHDVSLARVLGEIGEKVGFTVVDNALSPTMVNASIRDATVDEAVRQLLRGENHTVLYGAQSGAAPSTAPGIDKIVLLGEPSRLQATTEPGDRPQTHAVPGDWPHASLAPPLSSPLVSMPLLSPEADAADQSAPNPESPRVTVGDMLKAHAMGAAQNAEHAAEGVTPRASVPGAGLETVLAETTRRAQQSLAELLEGLAAATRSLTHPVPAVRP